MGKLGRNSTLTNKVCSESMKAQPSGDVEFFKPVILLNHFGYHDPSSENPGSSQIIVGQSVGICQPYESLLYVLQGEIECHDYFNAHSSLRSGYLQCTVGRRGLTYSSFGSRDKEYIHLILHLPKKFKVDHEQYGNLEPELIPVIHAHGGHVVKILSGRYLGADTVIKTALPVLFLHITVKQGGTYSVHIADQYERTGLAYICSGKGFLGMQKQLGFTGESYEFNGTSDLLLQASMDADMQVVVIASCSVSQADLENMKFGRCEVVDENITSFGCDASSPFKVTMVDTLLSQYTDGNLDYGDFDTTCAFMKKTPGKLDLGDAFKRVSILNSAGEMEAVIQVDVDSSFDTESNFESLVMAIDEPQRYGGLGAASLNAADKHDHKSTSVSNAASEQLCKCLCCGVLFMDEIAYKEHCISSSCSGAPLKPHAVDRPILKAVKSCKLEKKSLSPSLPGKPVFCCQTCGKKFQLEKNLLMHRQLYCSPFPVCTPDGKVLYNCQKCEIRLTSEQAFKTHFRDMHGQAAYFCNLCGLVFSRGVNLRKHQLDHPNAAARSSSSSQTPSTLKLQDRKAAGMSGHRNDADVQDVKSELAATGDGEKAPKSKSERSEVRYKCSLCGEFFRNKKTIVRHYRTAHASLPWFCNLCSGVYKSKDSLRKHKYKVHNFRARHSSTANPDVARNEKGSKARLYSSSDALRNSVVGSAVLSPEVAKKRSCDICGKSFRSSNELTEHRLCVHEKLKRFSCSKCCVSFIYKKSLVLHLSKCSKEGLSPSGVTEKLESRPKQVRNGAEKKEEVTQDESAPNSDVARNEKGSKARLDSSDDTLRNSFGSAVLSPDVAKKRSCDTCGKSFRSSNELTEHRLCVHEKLKRFSCSKCCVSFIYKKSLVLHLSKCSKEDLSPSGVTDKSGSRSKQVGNPAEKKQEVLHDESSKLGSPPVKTALAGIKKAEKLAYKCLQCSMDFSDRKACQSHINATHSRSSLPKAAKRRAVAGADHDPKTNGFNSPRSPKAFKCPNCPIKFKSLTTCDAHMASRHKILSLDCHICGDVFTSTNTKRRHMNRVHEKKKTFFCSTCNEGFVYSNQRDKHMLSHPAS